MIFEVIGKKTLLLNPEELARVCNVDVKTLYNKKSQGSLPFNILKGLGAWQVSVSDLLQYLNSGQSFSTATQADVSEHIQKPKQQSKSRKPHSRPNDIKALRKINRGPVTFPMES